MERQGRYSGDKPRRSTRISSGQNYGGSMSELTVVDDSENEQDELEFLDNDELMMDCATAVIELEDPLIADTSMTAEWEMRPTQKDFSSKTTTITFHQIDIDHYIAYNRVSEMPGARTGPVPVLRIYGLTEEGVSVCCHVHGFCPYFYVSLPSHFQVSDGNILRSRLNIAILKEIKQTSQNVPKPVLNVEIVEKMSMYGFCEQKQSFAKITMAIPMLIHTAKRLLEESQISGLEGHSYSMFESNIDFVSRFMVDCNIVGCNWLELQMGSYALRIDSQKVSRCQIEVDVACDNLISHKPEGDWSKVAPFRILSFDLECEGRKGVFPEPDKDPVIQIANIVMVQGQPEPCIKTVFTLNTCAPILGTRVVSFSDEKEMLHAWSEFIRKIDPDLLTGYNINNFDLWYLLKRAEQLQVKKFGFLGRVKNIRSVSRDVIMQSKQTGKRENKIININGRVIFDLYPVILREHKLRSYTLNSVSYYFLGEQKEDVHHSVISDLQNGNELSRRRLAIYCMKDALLPLLLLNKLMCIINHIEMARITGVPLVYLLTRGQQVKVFSQLLRKAKQYEYIIPVIEARTGDQQYEGATVIEPNRGYYDTPITVLDFASLYPSIIMAHNLCYTTFLNPCQINSSLMKIEDVEWIKTPSGNHFVKPSVRKGILPMILEDLLVARKKAKSDLKNETDHFKRQILDGRQLALKVSANSVYGFTGAQIGKLPCLEISQSVTAFGREMIEKTKNEIETQFGTHNGYQHDAKVIYGDTDSCMIRFGVNNVAEAIALGKEAAMFVSAKFISPIKLEFEKVYFPYLLINKKRYAGLYFTKPEIHDKMEVKGMETVRRDNCPMVASVLNAVLKRILINRDPNGALECAKGIISDLLQQKIDISQLVITKELKKNEYIVKQAHVELANKMKLRDAGSAPKLGDRVPYVITKGAKNTPLYKRSEDPIYVLENNIPIDTTYYLENQLSKPLVRIFEPILGEKAESILLRGEHTRSKVVVTPKVGPLSRFLKKGANCVGCRAIVREEKTALCDYCQPRTTEIYLEELKTQSELELRFNRLWTQCQRCQGSLHEEVLCTSRDCPIYYQRRKVIRDLEFQDDRIRRFD